MTIAFKTGLTALALSASPLLVPALAQNTDEAETAAEVSIPAKEGLDTLDKQVSYLLGHSNIEQLKSQGVAIDVNAFILGAVRANEDQDSIFTDEETQAIFMQYQQKLQEKATADLNREAEDNAQASRAFLAMNAEKDDVTVTESGLQYKVIEAGNGAKPTAANKVKVHYEGRLINGDVFDSSIQRGAPLEFSLNAVIRGWTEALQLMPVGSKYELYIPSELAYGPDGPSSIGPNQALIFEVELIDIVG